MKKLHGSRGETLIEVLASILIASLSVALMFGCVMVSTRMDERARDVDIQHYDGLSAADAQPAPAAGTALPPERVTISRIADPDNDDTPLASQSVDVELYGTKAGDMFSYSYKRERP